MLGLTYIKNKIRGDAVSGAILMYHHIRDIAVDPWETAVSPAYFREHLDVLRRQYQVLAIGGDNIGTPKAGSRKKIFITFDDGYLDNYEAAVPALKKHGFPATFFIPTQILRGEEFFWWEIVDQLFWEQETLPDALALRLGNDSFISETAPALAARRPRAEGNWSANTQPPPTEYCRLYVALCDWIKKQSPDDQQAITRKLTDWCQDKRPATSRKMLPGQIRELSREGFGIGAHTIHHPALGFQAYDIQRQEITGSRHELETLLGKEVTTLAYPHGHLNQDTVPITRQAGYQYACTTEAGGIKRTSDLLALPRIWVRNMDGASFERALAAIFKRQTILR